MKLSCRSKQLIIKVRDRNVSFVYYKHSDFRDIVVHYISISSCNSSSSKSNIIYRIYSRISRQFLAVF